MITSNKFETLRVAFLFPSLAGGGYWQPVLARFSRKVPNTLVITGSWKGFIPAYQDSFQVHVVGQTKFIHLPFKKRSGHYPIGIVLPPIYKLIATLWDFKPHVVFVSGFTLWTLLSILFKIFYRWKVIVLYDGSSPSVDRTNYKPILIYRRILSRFCDFFISNTQVGKHYLVQYLRIPENKVKVHPYEVPDIGLWEGAGSATPTKNFPMVVFLTVGSLIPRKGLLQLIEAVNMLRECSVKNVKVLLVGEGPLRTTLQEKIREFGLNDMIELVGHIEYQKLGEVISHSDVFVFPSLEDVWGVAPLEAMAMGKPVITSKYAGAHELVEEGVNGFIVDPLDVQSLADLMLHFVEQPQLIQDMGRKARATMQQFTPDNAAEFLVNVAVETYERNF